MYAACNQGAPSFLPELTPATFPRIIAVQFADPPGRVQGVPQFAKTKKRESYFQEFCSVTENFEENRVKAHRLSDEAAFLSMQVSSRASSLPAVSFCSP